MCSHFAPDQSGGTQVKCHSHVMCKSVPFVIAFPSAKLVLNWGMGAHLLKKIYVLDRHIDTHQSVKTKRVLWEEESMQH